MNHRPFNLEAAKRGEPIICRDHSAARFIAHVPEADATHAVVFIVNGKIRTAESTGWFFGRDSAPSEHDLFMAPVVNKGWVNVIMEKGTGAVEMKGPYITKSGADAWSLGCWKRIACIEIEYTEGQGL